MEYTLRAFCLTKNQETMSVLILILMEYTLRVNGMGLEERGRRLS